MASRPVDGQGGRGGKADQGGQSGPYGLVQKLQAATAGDHGKTLARVPTFAMQGTEQLVEGVMPADVFAAQADLVIGAVLIPGAAAPRLVTRDMLKLMRKGSVLVDVAIDQGGCAETSKATTHADPTYVVDEVVHYCVANMPGAVARTSTLALNNATLPFVIALAEKGPRRALEEDPHLLAGLNVARGAITCASVAEAHGLAYQPASGVLASL